jgi:N-methylhydantoinase B
MSSRLESIQVQVMWNRLIAVVEEQAQALLRTAFGSVAREAGDLSAGVYDVAGRMLAPATMKPGDVYVTNDPWLGTGHLFDYVVVTPVFASGRLIALFASTCHTIDVGGIGFSADARSVYEEGTCIPHLRLLREGRLNDDVIAIVEANSRNPVEARGDILSLVSSNEVGAARLVEMMAEFGLDSIDALAEHIIGRSRAATRRLRAADRPARAPDDRGRPHRGRLRRKLAGLGARHQLAQVLHRRLLGLRAQVPNRARGAEQRRLARAVRGAC